MRETPAQRYCEVRDGTGWHHDLKAHNPKVAGSNPAPATICPGQLCAGQGVLRLGPASTGNEALEEPCGVGLHAGEPVVVGLDREGWVCMAEAFADDLHGHAGLDDQGGVGGRTSWSRMRGTSTRATIRIEALGDGVWVGGSSVGLGEHVPAAGRASSSLAVASPPGGSTLYTIKWTGLEPNEAGWSPPSDTIVNYTEPGLNEDPAAWWSVASMPIFGDLIRSPLSSLARRGSGHGVGPWSSSIKC